MEGKSEHKIYKSEEILKCYLSSFLKKPKELERILKYLKFCCLWNF